MTSRFCSGRRQFLKRSATACVAAVAAPYLLAAPSATAAPTLSSFAAVTTAKSIIDIDLTTGNTRHLTLEFQPHSIVQSPHDLDQVLAIERWGANLAVIDRTHWAVKQNITCARGTNFQGHAAYHPTQRSFYATTVQSLSGQSFLIEKDCSFFTTERELRLTRAGAHQCLPASPSKMLFASTGIEPNTGLDPDRGDVLFLSSIDTIDIASGVTIDRIVLSDKDQSINHFALVHPNTIIATTVPHLLSAQKSGSIYMAEPNTKFERVSLPTTIQSRLYGALSAIAIDPTRRLAAITNPQTQILLLIDLASRTFVRAVENAPAHVAYEPQSQQFIGATDKLVAVLPDGDMHDLPYFDSNALATAHSAHVAILSRPI